MLGVGTVKTTVLVFLLATMSATFADPVVLPVLKIGSREYVSVSIEKDGEVMAKVTHEAGVSRVRMLDLPKDVREKLGVDEAAEKSVQAQEDNQEKRQRQIAARAAAREQMLAATPLRLNTKKQKTPPVGVIRITEIQPGGLVGKYGYRDPMLPFRLYSLADYGPGEIFVITRMDRGKFVDGETYPVEIVKVGTHTFTTVLGASRTIPKWKDIELVLDEKFPDTARKSNP